VAEIAELVGRHSALAEGDLIPRLRRENRLRTLHASLAIENNSLSLEQVTAVIAGKRVLGDPREIREVQNAFAAYDAMEEWDPASVDDLLAAHALLMKGLASEAGSFRSGGVGIFRGEQLVHMAPPASRVPELVGDLFRWLRQTPEHPLVAGCLVHYELEFIHPFEDGNGRMGRLWQSLVLRRWKSLFAWLPVETVIRERQERYYEVLSLADRQGDAAPFADFMLGALGDALREGMAKSQGNSLGSDQAGDQASDQVSDQADDQVSDHVARLLSLLAEGEMSAASLMEKLHLSHRPSFRKNYLNPALKAGFVERTIPHAPRSPAQRYRLTTAGKRRLEEV
jgi:Fic family protein